MQVRDVMRHPAVSCTASTTFREAAELMRTNDIGTVAVVDERGTLTGLVTDRDLVLRGFADGFGPETPIKRAMSGKVYTVYGYDDAFAAATKMERHELRRLPVIDREGRLLGVVSFDDLLPVFAAQLEKLAHTR